MILIPVMENMDNILKDMPNLINKLESGQIDLQSESVDFVRKLENACDNYRLPISGQLSIIRGKLLCGISESKDQTANQTRKERKANQNRYILTQLESAYNCASAYFEESRKIFIECERTVCQIITRLIDGGILQNHNPHELSGNTLIQLASENNELSPALIQITGLIGALNTNIIFEKTMSLAGIYNKEENQ